MLPPKIVLLIGNRGENVQSIKRSLSAQYQVILFNKVEPELSWFNPVAAILYQNGGPAEEVMQQLRQLKQLKPQVPVLLCRSGEEAFRGRECPPGFNASLALPGDLLRLHELLPELEKRRLGLARHLQLAWQAMARSFSPPAAAPAPPPLPVAGAQPAAQGLDARLLGAFELRAGGRILPPIRSEVNRAMLAYLICNGPERILRHKIIEGFWPDSAEEAARNCLNVAISSVRRYWKEHGTGQLEISCRDNAYFLQAPGPVNTDVKTFLRLWERARSLERAGRMDEALNAYRRACELYSGDFLESVTRNIEWVESTRSKLKEAYLSALDRMAVLLMERALYQEAEDTCRKILDIDDCIEGAHRQLMLVYCHTQQRSKALRQYAWCCQALKEKLGAGPFPETEALHRRIVSGRL
ncbi:MAG: bacterial transcriptional activator domain-containing protein [Phaeodactylibacter sp.]|nr:bacterial transcriptional activator domain-containing protein [Phaeodactylibacter sp.]